MKLEDTGEKRMKKELPKSMQMLIQKIEDKLGNDEKLIQMFLPLLKKSKDLKALIFQWK